jgi:hypothetical protein
VALVLGVCREITSLLAGLAFLRGAPMQPSRLEPALCAASRGIPASCMAAKKVDRISHALHLRGVMVIVTSSVCCSSDRTVTRPASVQDRRYSRAVLQGYAKSLTFKKLLTWKSRLPGLARLRRPIRPPRTLLSPPILVSRIYLFFYFFITLLINN